jgi:hypothetical protein
MDIKNLIKIGAVATLFAIGSTKSAEGAVNITGGAVVNAPDSTTYADLSVGVSSKYIGASVRAVAPANEKISVASATNLGITVSTPIAGNNPVVKTHATAAVNADGSNLTVEGSVQRKYLDNQILCRTTPTMISGGYNFDKGVATAGVVMESGFDFARGAKVLLNYTIPSVVGVNTEIDKEHGVRVQSCEIGYRNKGLKSALNKTEGGKYVSWAVPDYMNATAVAGCAHKDCPQSKRFKLGSIGAYYNVNLGARGK